MLACHKLDPSGGLGATTAIHDAVCLANWINVLPSLDIKETEKIFQEYYLERYPIAVANYEASRLMEASNGKVGSILLFFERERERASYGSYGSYHRFSTPKRASFANLPITATAFVSTHRT